MWIATAAGVLLLLGLVGSLIPAGSSNDAFESVDSGDDTRSEDEGNLITVLLAGHDHDGHGHHREDDLEGSQWN